MLIEIGPRKIGRCDFKFDSCTAKGVNIVRKVISASGDGHMWACQKCLIKKSKSDREGYQRQRSRMLG